MKRWVMIAVSLFVSSCASQNQTIYKPDDYDVKTKTVVSENFNATWERLVENLAKSFFVINNIEKESRIINVSFSSSSPGDYVDCGYGIITVNGDSRRVAFTENAQYPYVYQQGMYKYVGSARRQANLEGRVNIYMKQVDSGKTEVSANAKYVLDVTIRRFTVAGQQYEQTSDSVTFQSLSPSTQASGKIQCRSKGELEEAILNMALS